MAIVPVDVQISVLPPGAATAAAQALALAELLQKLETADLQLTTSKELVTLPTALIGAVEAKLVAFPGAIPKAAFGYTNLEEAYRSAALASGAAWVDILSIAGAGILESVTFSTNWNQTLLRVVLDSIYLGIPHHAGAVHAAPSPLTLNNIAGDSSWWKETLYDAVNDYYVFYLKRPVQFNATLVVGVLQNSGVPKNVAAQAVWRRIG